MEHWHTTDAVWPDGSPDDLAWLSALDDLPALERADVKVGIGIATGADKIYIQKQADVEPSRLASIFHDGPVWGWSAPVASRLF